MSKIWQYQTLPFDFLLPLVFVIQIMHYTRGKYRATFQSRNLNVLESSGGRIIFLNSKTFLLKMFCLKKMAIKMIKLASRLIV